jgi:hypothetical protein
MWSRITEWGNGLFSRTGGGALQGFQVKWACQSIWAVTTTPKTTVPKASFRTSTKRLLWVVARLA